MPKGSNPQPDTTDNVPMEDEAMSTSQETAPVPLFAGEVKLAGRFITPIYGQRQQKAPATRGGKK